MRSIPILPIVILLALLLFASYEALADEIDLSPRPYWSSDDISESYCVVWEDFDKDGDQDLAVGRNGFNVIYENINGILDDVPVWESLDDNVTHEMMWADIDENGWPDLIACNGAWGAGEDVMYLNFEGNLSTTPNWTSDNSDHSNGMDLGDWDSDGDLDLVTANYDGTECIYENTGGNFSTTPVWESYAYDDGTTDVLFFDVNDDDELDLFVACSATMDGNTDSNANRMYINDPDGLFGRYGLLADWTANDDLWTTTVKAADIDGDDDIDIIAANGLNNSDLVVMYENTGTSLDPDYNWSFSYRWPFGCDLGDVDGDGWLDVAVSSYFEKPVVVRNVNGSLETNYSWIGSDINRSYRCAFGDMNGDGNPDLAVANFDRVDTEAHDVVYLNGEMEPWVSIEEPSEWEELAGTVTISGSAGPPSGDDLMIDVSLDNGSSWGQANGSAEWTYEWDTSMEDDGDHVIMARARIDSKHSDVAYLNVTVDNSANILPHILLIEPDGDDDTADTRFAIEWNAWDDDENDTVEVALFWDIDDELDGATLIEDGLEAKGEYTWNTTDMPNGSYYIHVNATDQAGEVNWTYGGPVVVKHDPDNAVPWIQVIEPDGVDDVADTKFTIIWDSGDDDGDDLEVKLYYDEDQDDGNGYDHIATVDGEDAEYEWGTKAMDDGEYYILAIVTDGNDGEDRDYSPGPVSISHDTAGNDPPTVEIDSPYDGETVSGTVTIEGTASDPDGDEDIDRVRVRIGSKKYKDVDGLEDWEYEWDTTDFENGEIEITVKVHDENGSTDTDTIEVTVDNVEDNNIPPDVFISYPVQGTTISGIVTVSGTASDTDGTVHAVAVRIDGGGWEAADGKESWTWSWNTRYFDNGEHIITVRALDEDGDHSSMSIDVTVENEANSEPVVVRFGSENRRYERGDTMIATGRIEDENGFEDIITLTAYIRSPDGKLIETIRNGSIERERKTDDSITFSFTYELDKDLDLGVYNMTIEALDIQGGQGTRGADFTIVDPKDDSESFMEFLLSPTGVFTMVLILIIIIAALMVRAGRKGPAPQQYAQTYQQEVPPVAYPGQPTPEPEAYEVEPIEVEIIEE